jgi:predicted ATPase/class 3 adenylate cyclase
MGQPSTGTITLLFSDIEGSTALLRRLGERYGEALSAERALLRAAFREGHGREMGTEGDSFFVVFESAGDAVRSCLAAQGALSRHDWPGGIQVRVRMGLHSGAPTPHEDGYIGLDVHRAARIAAAAHGGQVVLSDATRRLAESQLPAGVSVRDLGFHRLKDIEAAEHIYQLGGPGLAERFPPLKSLGAQTSLPASVTPLVGRDRELRRLRAAILKPTVRLVTLTGTGGVGKTRLALAAAASLGDAFEHGVFFVALAAARDAEVMWKTITGDLDADGDGDRPADESVCEYLRDRHALLVLDNLEQLDGAAGVVTALLAAAPRVAVLATSRRPLHLAGEHEWPVPPLPPPAGPDVEDVAASAAARLFVQQAGLVRPGFAVAADNAGDIAAICQRLDGLPLAIELAAARVKLLTPKAILTRLGHILGLAAADVGRPWRQQTLRQTIAWSYDLLTDESADVLRRAGVFAGGCDLDALAAVALDRPGQAAADLALGLTAELLDVSLITVTEGADGEPRIGLLETIRQYALERLDEAGDLEGTRRRHAEHYAAFAERAAEQLTGREHLAWIDRLEAEHDNLRAALSWSFDPRAADAAARAAIGLRLVQALSPFWYHHGDAMEGRRWLRRAIDLAPQDAGRPLARMMHGLAILLDEQGETAAALPLFERSLAIWQELGDRDEQARELNSLGIIHRHLDDLDTARRMFQQSIALAREIGSDFRLASALANLGQAESAAGNFDRATQALREALELDEKQGDVFGVAIDQQSLAVVSLRAGRPRDAVEPLRRMLDYVAGVSDTGLVAHALELAAAITAGLGDGLRAARLAGAAERIREKTGMPITKSDAALLERYLAPARAAAAPGAWQAELAAGRKLSQPQAITLLLDA